MNRQLTFPCPLVLVLILATPSRVRAQQPLQPQPADGAFADFFVGQEPPQLAAPLPIELPQPPRPNQMPAGSPLGREQQRMLFFQRMSKDRHHDVEVALNHQKPISGRVLSADSDGFVFRARHNKQETTIRYQDVAYWQEVPTEGQQVLQITALILITIPLLPLFLLGRLAGWEC